MSAKIDLEDRLIEFGVVVVRITEALPGSRAGNHIAGQLVRSATSPAPNYGEAQSAESSSDFVHKLKVCLKELRETRVWLKMILRAKMADDTHAVEAAIDECNQLISIFVASVRTSRKKSGRQHLKAMSNNE